MSEEYNYSPLQNYQASQFRFLTFALLYTAIILFFYEVLGNLLSLAINDFVASGALPYVQGLIQLLFMLIPTLIISRYSPLSFSDIFRLREMPTLIQVIAAFSGIITFQFFVSGYASIQEALIPDVLKQFYENIQNIIEKTYDTLLGGGGTLGLVRGLIVGAIIPAFCEEFLFRGFCQRHLEERLQPKYAILITALIFGCIHMNPINLVPLVGIGIYLGYLAYLTKSLVLPILIHFLNNAWAVISLNYVSVKDLTEKHMIFPLLPAFAICFIGLGLTYLALRLVYKGSFKYQQ